MIDKLSGTQTARQREAAFEEWATEFEEQIKDNTKAEIVEKRVASLISNRSKCKLQRTALRDELGFPDTQPFTKNHFIEPRLKKLESKLRPKYLEHVPDENVEGGAADTSESKSDVEQGGGTLSCKECAELTQRNLELEAQIAAMSEERGRFRELTEVFQRMARM